MNDEQPTPLSLSTLLRHPDDLDKIPLLKSDFLRKKAAVDTSLRHGLSEQLAITSSGMSALTEGQRTVNLIKEEMMKIDKLCAEAQNMIRDFPHVDLVARTHRNFVAVEGMKKDIDSFQERLEGLERLLAADDADLEGQENLLAIHYGLTQLRDVRDSVVDQVKGAEDDVAGELVNNLRLEGGQTLQELFGRLNSVVEWFDEHVMQACLNIIPLVEAGKSGLVVRLALVIEEEEKNDQKAKAMQDAQREYKELASRFKSIAAAPKELRGYKEKFLKAIESSAQPQFNQSNKAFMDDPDKLAKSVNWYFSDLNAVKQGIEEAKLMPRKWKIFKTYVQIYHRLFHDWLIELIDDPELNPPHMLAIVNWVDKYYKRMKKLGAQEDWMQPHLVDKREVELVRDYRNLIMKAVEEWMDRMLATDRQNFLNRKEGSMDVDPNGCLRTKTMPDMWRMLSEQLSVAASSQRTDVIEGVVDAMLRTIKNRQSMWQTLVDTELEKYRTPGITDHQGLQDWLVAIANDQIACIDDNEDAGQVGFLTRFKQEYEPLVSPQYVLSSGTEVDSLRDAYVDTATHCITSFVLLIFTVDFRDILTEFFTSTWYEKKGMGQIISTFEDYLSDYNSVIHPIMRDIFLEELADLLLLRYLQSVRNRSVKFRRTDPFTDKIRDDILTVFQFFERNASSPDDFERIKQKWRAVDRFVRLLESDKHVVPSVYEQFKQEYWDLQLSWVEAVLKTRDDYDRSLLSAVKAKAAEVGAAGERGEETVMGKVR